MDGWEQGGSAGSGERWLDVVYIVKAEPIIFWLIGCECWRRETLKRTLLRVNLGIFAWDAEQKHPQIRKHMVRVLLAAILCSWGQPAWGWSPCRVGRAEWQEEIVLRAVLSPGVHTWSRIHLCTSSYKSQWVPFVTLLFASQALLCCLLGHVFQRHHSPKETSHSPIRTSLQTSGLTFSKCSFLCLSRLIGPLAHCHLKTRVLPQGQGQTSRPGRRSEVISRTALFLIVVAVPACYQMESRD